MPPQPRASRLPPRPRAILFDLGGTILEERGYDLAAGVRELLTSALVPTRRGAGEEAPVLAELQREIDRVHATNTAEFSLRRWLEVELETGASSARAERALWRRSVDLEPMPGVREAIAALRADGLPMAVVSNAVFGSETLADELARHGLLAGFAFVLSSADLGVRKPAPGIFREALARLGRAPTETWFVGDSFTNDVAGAHGVGVTPIWLAAGTEPVRPELPHQRVGSWADLLGLYRSLERPAGRP